MSLSVWRHLAAAARLASLAAAVVQIGAFPLVDDVPAEPTASTSQTRRPSSPRITNPPERTPPQYSNTAATISTRSLPTTGGSRNPNFMMNRQGRTRRLPVLLLQKLPPDRPLRAPAYRSGSSRLSKIDSPRVCGYGPCRAIHRGSCRASHPAATEELRHVVSGRPRAGPLSTPCLRSCARTLSHSLYAVAFGAELLRGPSAANHFQPSNACSRAWAGVDTARWRMETCYG